MTSTFTLLGTASPIPAGGDGWRALAAAHFHGTIELGDDLHQVVVGSTPAPSGV
jgi:hypothetical protein